MSKICGVYRITSPCNKIYIGSSVDIKTRFRKYQLLHCKSQTRLYNSFLKYGVDNHKFEIILQCKKEDLLRLEGLAGLKYGALGENGLNCLLPKSNDKLMCITKSTRQKISSKHKGKKLSIEHRLKMSIAHKGKPKSKEHAIAVGLAQRGKVLSPEHRVKLSDAHKNRKPEVQKERLRKMSESKKKPVLNTQTGEMHHGIEAAAMSLALNKFTLAGMLNGHKKNKTPFVYA